MREPVTNHPVTNEPDTRREVRGRSDYGVDE